MKKSKKLFLGFLTFWPFAYIFVFFFFVIAMMALAGVGDGSLFGLLFIPLFVLHFLTIIAAIGMQIYYIVNVFNNKNVDEDQRVMWVILLVLAGLFVSPVYWYLNIWKDEEEELPANPYLNPAEQFQAADQQARGFGSTTKRAPEPHGWSRDD